jgi:hypothetical protein
MLQFYAELFFKTVKDLFAIESLCHINGRQDSKRIMTPHHHAKTYAEVGVLSVECVTLGLSSSAQKCGRIHAAMEGKNGSIRYEECGEWLKDLRERLEDDLHAHLFLQLTPKEAELYNNPTKQWEPVIHRFPKTKIDVEESSKCFSLNRYAASLFHMLLVAEYGVIAVAELLGVAGDKPGWGALDRLQKTNDKKWSDKTLVEKQYSDLLGKILPLMFSIKNEWRHKISHVDNKLEWVDTDFSPQVAERIISATLGFMLCLAAELPKS